VPVKPKLHAVCHSEDQTQPLLLPVKPKLQVVCHSEDQTLPLLVPVKPKLQAVCHSKDQTQLLLVNMTPKLEVVCRAEGWGDWSRCAVRMTAKGSVTPWMACGSRPVEIHPPLGPAVGLRQREAWTCFGSRQRPPSGKNQNKPYPVPLDKEKGEGTKQLHREWCLHLPIHDS
jgi:hypothetical protein